MTLFDEIENKLSSAFAFRIQLLKLLVSQHVPDVWFCCKCKSVLIIFIIALLLSLLKEEIDSCCKARGNVAKLVNRLSKDLSFNRGSDVAFRRPTGMVRLSTESLPCGSATTTTTTTSSNSAVRIANVRFSYKAAHDDELNLEVNDVIEVIEEAEAGWMKGKLRSTGVIGLFPTNFVDLVETQSGSGNGMVKLTETKKKGSEFILDDSPEALQRTSTVDSTSKSKSSSSLPSSDNKKEVGCDGDGPAKEMARVLYTYKPEHDDELALQKVGALVTIVSKTCPDPGWFIAEVDGKRGLIPDNFVELITSSTSSPANVSSDSHKIASPSTISTVPPPVVPTKPTKPPGLGVSSTGGIRRVSSNSFAATLADALTRPPKPFVSKVIIINDILQICNEKFVYDVDCVVVSRPEDNSSSEPRAGDERLSHITTTRPKQPKKRPPSTILSKRKSTDNILELSIAEEVNSVPAPAAALSFSTSPSSSTSASTQLPSLSVPSSKQQSHLHHSSSCVSASPKTSGVSTAAADSEFVTRAEYNRLQAKFDEFRNEMNQRLIILEAKLVKQSAAI
ncbi:unnamed protein product [Anisakis simplex]|uniref:SH3 domain-containing kinase-binding protein 1 n=1 Tax=Anisakis simplex TaxID=6269 RepID=A0A0M3JWD4_ANISI|nr:unnamed protein product [Anisakis simplex]